MENKRLSELITQLKNVAINNRLNISDETIFEQACTYERGELANQNKSYSKPLPSQAEPCGNTDKVIKGSDNPTEKQINFLKKHNIKINPKLTKQEAKIMIGNYFDNLEGKNIWIKDMFI